MSKVAPEAWAPVSDYEGRYWVSTLGQVRGTRGFLSPQTDRDGYVLVGLWLDGRQHALRRVHRLMAEAFLPAPLPGQTDACHNDGDPSNNVLSNIRWDTHANNMADIRKHGTARNQNTGKTECKRGHSLTDVYVYKGGRTCRICRQIRQRRSRQQGSAA